MDINQDRIWYRKLHWQVLGAMLLGALTEQLRFSKPEIARFFGGDLMRRELNDIADRTAGWPVALRIDRSMRSAGTATSIERGKALTRDSLDARLLRGLPDRDRALLLDLAGSDWSTRNWWTRSSNRPTRACESRRSRLSTDSWCR